MTPAEALAALRLAYRQHVERLAEELKPRLLAGEFNGYTDDESDIRWNEIEAICRKAPRPWGDAAVTIGLATPRARDRAYNAHDPGTSNESGQELDESVASFAIAWDVRDLAFVKWGAPLDDVWGDPAVEELQAQGVLS